MAEVPKKRGRGRPRKNTIIETIPEIQPAEICILDGLDNQFHGGSNIEVIRDADPDDAPDPIPYAPAMPTYTGFAGAGHGTAGAYEEEEERVTMAPIPKDFTFSPPYAPEDKQEMQPTYAPPPPPPPMMFAPKPQPPDDREERRQLIDRIKKYRQGFDAAKALPFNEDMSTERLRSLLDDIRLCISSRNTSLIFRSGYLTAVKGVELVGTKTGLRCYGLADALGKSNEVSDLLKEIEAEVGIKYVSPWKRLAFITVTTAVVLDGMNRRAEVLATYKQEAVNPVLDERYKDL